MDGFEFQIVEHIGVLGESPTGWKKEFNLVSWNKREPKYDIRDWSPDHQKMGKGVSLSEAEARQLLALLSKEL